MKFVITDEHAVTEGRKSTIKNYRSRIEVLIIHAYRFRRITFLPDKILKVIKIAQCFRYINVVQYNGLSGQEFRTFALFHKKFDEAGFSFVLLARYMTQKRINIQKIIIQDIFCIGQSFIKVFFQLGHSPVMCTALGHKPVVHIPDLPRLIVNFHFTACINFYYIVKHLFYL